MPEFAADVEEGEHQNGSGPIPNLFPDKLVDLCLDKVLLSSILIIVKTRLWTSW